jgi:2-methylisocitrate lyase-like PEP mutase family enzyme
MSATGDDSTASDRGLQGIATTTTATEKRRELRRLIDEARLLVPGATDALGARLITRSGFRAAYASGAGIANAQFGVPDVGLISLAEVVEQVGRITASTDLPVIADADTGFGGPLTAMRAVSLFERAGVAAIQIEDQEMPKRCGHFDDHRLISSGHMQAKIAAVVAARQDESLVLVARTDARSAEGLTQAVDRAHAYVEAGADVIFIESPRTVDELALIGKELAGVPLVVNVVEGGKTPELSVAEYADLGFSVVLYANYLMRSMMHSGLAALAHLRDAGETVSRADRMVTWEERQSLFNLPAFAAAERHYDQTWTSADRRLPHGA